MDEKEQKLRELLKNLGKMVPCRWYSCYHHRHLGEAC